MESNKGSAVVIVAIVLVLMFGAVYMFTFSESMKEPDPHESERRYAVSGTVNGLQCTGEGSAEYTPENTNYHTYAYALRFTDSSGNEHTMTFGMVFGSDDLPDRSIYAYLGTDDGGRGIWGYSEDGVSYIFHVSEHCVVTSFTASSGSMDISCTLDDDSDTD